MRNAQDRKEAFLKELQELLDKHGAELEVGEDDGTFGMQQGVANIHMHGNWDKDNNCTDEFVEFDLPKYMYSSS